MANYNYMEAMTEDIRNYISNEITLSDFSGREELEEHLNDTLWAEDSVTGNACGSYTFNTFPIPWMTLPHGSARLSACSDKKD